MRTYSLILFFLCGWMEVVFAQTAADYHLPLNVGNYLLYRTTGNWEGRTVTEFIEGTDSISGQLYYRLKAIEVEDATPSDTNVRHVFWLKEDSARNILIGAMSLGESSDIDSATVYSSPGVYFPNEILTLGYSTSSFYNGIFYQDSVVSISETVVVPAGTFTNCIKFMSTRKDTLGTTIRLKYEYYAYGIGKVKSAREIPVNDAHTQELVQYNFVTSVDENNVVEVPTYFSLYQNYPNPFNPSTEISYVLSFPGFVTLKIYDVLGKEIRILVHEYQTPNRYSFHFDASEFSGGIYFYELQIDNNTMTKKMLLLK